MKKDNPDAKKGKINTSEIAVLFSVIIAVAAFLFEMYFMMQGSIQIIILCILAVVIVFALCVCILNIINLKKERQQEFKEQYEAILKSEKATYLLQRKYFNDIQESLNQMRKEAKQNLDEITTTEKSVGKIVMKKSLLAIKKLEESTGNIHDKFAMLEVILQDVQDSQTELNGLQKAIVESMQNLNGDVVRKIEDVKNAGFGAGGSASETGRAAREPIAEAIQPAPEPVRVVDEPIKPVYESSGITAEQLYGSGNRNPEPEIQTGQPVSQEVEEPVLEAAEQPLEVEEPVIEMPLEVEEPVIEMEEPALEMPVEMEEPPAELMEEMPVELMEEMPMEEPPAELMEEMSVEMEEQTLEAEEPPAELMEEMPAEMAEPPIELMEEMPVEMTEPPIEEVFVEENINELPQDIGQQPENMELQSEIIDQEFEAGIPISQDNILEYGNRDTDLDSVLESIEEPGIGESGLEGDLDLDSLLESLAGAYESELVTEAGPIVEEPITEIEPIVEEPITEPEPVVEEKAAMPDLSDPNKVMTPEEIAALIANL